MHGTKPIAVLISDVHYNLQTLELADAAMTQAILRANSLDVPLVVAGDLTDNKANMRAEVVNRMLETFTLPKHKPYVLVGNHDKVNEKSQDHALNFLAHLTNIVDTPYVPMDIVCKAHFPILIPYQCDLAALKEDIAKNKRVPLFIMHQGILGSDSGEYIQDKTALSPNDVAGLRIISGHYHKRQDIELPEGGLWSYIGNPYTLNYAEANDPEKGFRILNDDGTLDFVPTNLRKHSIVDMRVDEPDAPANYKDGDLIWVKVRGSKEALKDFDRDPYQGCRLDLIPDPIQVQSDVVDSTKTDGELLDQLIASLSTIDNNKKEALRKLWRVLCE